MIDVGVLFQQAVAALRRERHATYRLQLGSTLGFDAVAALGPYLEALGVSDAYLSPCFRCGPGSSHGYDVTDHNAFNPEIGGAAAFDRLAAALTARGLGLILDVVPNHMGIAGDANPWWLDVLENGPASPRAGFFDIDWTPIKPELRDTVLLPVLPDQYGRVLESQQLQLEFADGAFLLRYAGARLPDRPRHLRADPRPTASTCSRAASGPRTRGSRSCAASSPRSSTCPGAPRRIPPGVEERLREKEIVKRRLAVLVQGVGGYSRARRGDGARRSTARPGDPASFDALDRLLSAQTYRLADWRVAGDEVNYRRFFDVNDLAAIRMEEPRGLRRRPRARLPAHRRGQGRRPARRSSGRALRARRVLPPAAGRRARGHRAPAPARAGARGGRGARLALYRARAAEQPAAPDARPLWIVAEKILSPGEPLPDWWAVAGTTGYDFLASVNGLFVDRGDFQADDRALHAASPGRAACWPITTYAAKRLIMQVSMASEINQLGHHLDRMSERNRLSRDFTLYSLVRAIRELIAAFSVYRTYVGDDGRDPSAATAPTSRRRWRRPSAATPP